MADAFEIRGCKKLSGEIISEALQTCIKNETNQVNPNSFHFKNI